MEFIANVVYLYWFAAISAFIIFHLLGIVRTDWGYLKKNKLKGTKFLLHTISIFPLSIICNAIKEPEEWQW